MASTYSTNLRLELIGNGDQSGTWGTTTNTNLGTLIEGAIAGYTTVSVTSAAQALTASNGAADQARLAVLKLTTTTAANFAIYAPPATKTYTIYNSTAYTATIYNSTVLGNTTAAGTGVAIPAGATVQVWSDGTNVLGITYHPSLTLGSALAVASGGTGAGTFTSGGLLRGNGTAALSVASAADITAAIGATAVTNATNATNATSAITATSATSASTSSTQAYGDATTNIATTAFVDRLRDVPQNAQSGNYTLALSDRGQSIDYTGTGGHTFTIPANASVAFPIGSTITIMNTTGNSLSLAITTDTLRQAGTVNTGTRTLGNYAMATIRKVSATVWIVGGSGIT